VDSPLSERLARALFRYAVQNRSRVSIENKEKVKFQKSLRMRNQIKETNRRLNFAKHRVMEETFFFNNDFMKSIANQNLIKARRHKSVPTLQLVVQQARDLFLSDGKKNDFEEKRRRRISLRVS